MLQAAHSAADSYAAKIVPEMVFEPELIKGDRKSKTYRENNNITFKVIQPLKENVCFLCIEF